MTDLSLSEAWHKMTSDHGLTASRPTLQRKARQGRLAEFGVRRTPQGLFLVPEESLREIAKTLGAPGK